jgi:hypothetical protein
MQIGDIVTMKTPLTPERYGLGLIQKIVYPRLPVPPGMPLGRMVYHILWPDGAISCQYDNEIVLMGVAE